MLGADWIHRRWDSTLQALILFLEPHMLITHALDFCK
jgi:hypothetical protein